MDFKKFTSEAKTVFNRTLQKTEEALKTSDRTLLDANLENLIKQCEMRQRWVSGLIGLVEAMIQPNPAMRVEDMVLKGFDRKKERQMTGEVIGDALVRIGSEVGAQTPNGSSMVKCGEAECAIGQSERILIQSIESGYLSWLRAYVNETCKNAMKERSKLEETRLDLDRAKTQLRRAGNDVNKKQTASEISQHEQEVHEAQTLFDRQCTVTRQAMEECMTKFNEHREASKQLLDAQLEYHQTCTENIQNALHGL